MKRRRAEESIRGAKKNREEARGKESRGKLREK